MEVRFSLLTSLASVLSENINFRFCVIWYPAINPLINVQWRSGFHCWPRWRLYFRTLSNSGSAGAVRLAHIYLLLYIRWSMVASTDWHMERDSVAISPPLHLECRYIIYIDLVVSWQARRLGIEHVHVGALIWQVACIWCTLHIAGVYQSQRVVCPQPVSHRTGIYQ